MSLLVLGLLLFLGIHSVAIVAPAWRDTQAARNEKAWKGIFALVSLAGFVLLVYGYGLARQSPVVLYTPPAGMRHLVMLLMLPVFPLLLAAYLPGRIKTLAKHPMLLATKLWALSHLLVNGTLADVLLFGGFLVWAIADRISLKRRPVRAVPGAPPSPANDAIVVVVGLALYGLFVWRAHAWLIGVSPL
ncbi:MAG: NnrU family protein [Cytophagales bacterium]|nr:NnrU family protein [Rhizobacter sp.]